MGGSSQSCLRRRGWFAIGGLLITAAFAVLAIWAMQPDGYASAATGGPEMGLNVISGGGCDTAQPTTCDVPVDGDFTLAIDLLEAPVAGYVGWDTWLTFPTDLLGIGTIVWPEAECLEVFVLPPPGTDYHGCITGLIPPVPVSTFEGTLVELNMTCSTTATQNKLHLLPYGDPAVIGAGTGLMEPSTKIVTIPKLNPLTVNCVEPLSEPGDTDGDGCSDQQELGLDSTHGGQRNFANPWDFYDVLGANLGPPDGYIDLFNDMAGVIDHYAPTGTESAYDANFDRGPSSGPNQWNMTAPDGKIDLFNDIAGVISQIFHDCR